MHLLGLVSHGGVHSHIDHLRALLRFAPGEDRGSTRSRTAATSRRTRPSHDLAELPADRIATVAGRYYAMDRDQRWERTDRALAAITQGDGEQAADPVAAVQASYDAGVTDEFIEPVVLEGRPRLTPPTRRSSSTSARTAARQLSQRLLEAGYDLTTMTRYRDDLDCPVAFEEQEVAGDDGRGARRARPAPAARRRDREVRARDLLLQRRPRGGVARRGAHPRALAARGRHVRREAGDVGARSWQKRFCAEIGGGYAFAVLNFANPDMVGHTGVIPAVVKAVETTDACLGRVVDAVQAAGGVLLVTADHGNAETDARGGRREPAHGAHDQPGSARRHGAGNRALQREGSSPISCRRRSTCWASAKPAAMTGRSLVTSGRVKRAVSRRLRSR